MEPNRLASSRAGMAPSPSPASPKDGRRARSEIAFEDQRLLGPLFGQFDANLVQVENRLGVFISARGERIQIEGTEDAVARARDTLQAMYDRLAEGQELAFNLVDRGGNVSAADLQVAGDVIPVQQRAAAPQRQRTGEKATGTVKFFNSMKGFGFITRDDGEADAFVHISAVERSGLSQLNEGDRLVFEPEVDRRGKFSAVNLVPVQG